MRIKYRVFLIGVLGLVQLQAREYNVMDYGAVPDSNTVVTAALNRAIEDCSLGGGGRVVVPAGTYVTGTLVLKSNVELHLEQGARLLASKDDKDFPLFPPARYRSLKDAGGWSALIYAVDAHHIAVTGGGVIDGCGRGRKGRVTGVAGDCNGRPRNLLFISCNKVRVTEVELRNAAIWNQHYLDCEDVRVDGIIAYNHCNGNNDGIDIDGCRRFILTNSIIDSDDDGIVLKSTGMAPCENVIISHCVVSSYANAIKCGTESTGGFRNILISDCVVKPSSSTADRIIKSTPTGITALSLEVVDGGLMEGVTVDNILIEGTECPLYVRLANRGRKHCSSASQPPIGQMKDIRISRVTAYHVGNFGSSVTGIPEAKIENIQLSDIHFVSKGGLTFGSFRTQGDANGTRHDRAGISQPGRYWEHFCQVVEDEKGYPQPTVWGNLPSYGLFLRHVNQATVENVSFCTEAEDPRVPVLAVDVDRLRMWNMDVADGEKTDLWLSGVKDYRGDDDLKIKRE